MAVQYAAFKDVAIKDFDVLVVGAGFAGSVVANRLADRGNKKVLVIEKRNHIAGNMYDEVDKAGILVHKYGPHIFHTNIPRVFQYLRFFSGFTGYQHRVLADVNGSYVPVPFNKVTAKMVFGEEKGQEVIDKLIETFGDEKKVTITDLRAQEDPVLAEVAEWVYNNVFLYYTQKQWGVTPDEVDPSVVARVPIRISNDDRYFQDEFQGMPIFGYTKMFENMLDDPNITVCLNTDAESVFDLVFESMAEDAQLKEIRVKDYAFTGPIIYTGPIDELFLSRFGRLPYRSLDFEFETIDKPRVMPCGTVNYTVSQDYTRITEFKWMNPSSSKKTTIMREYPCEYKDTSKQIPYYPVITDDNIALHQRYVHLTESLPNFYPLGRLAEYRYYNMDIIVDRAFELSDKLMGEM